MTAPTTVPQVLPARKSPVDKFGVLTLSGFGVRVRTQNHHLEIEDGVGLERRNFRLPRVGHGLKRLVIIGNDGVVSMAALQWLADQNVSLTFLDRYGKLLFVSGPTVPGDARLRRTQALAMGNGVGLEICRALIDAKLSGEERVVRERLHNTSAANDIVCIRERLRNADTADAVRFLESKAAASYFGALKHTPIMWPKSDIRKIPDHWRTIGSRHSPLTGGPRLAVNPVHGILNYCFALLESETRLALTALGLLPDLGMGLHTDTAYRDSLALDVMEPVRPEVEAWVLDWITREPLRKSDFLETANGHCRLMSHLCAKLSQTSPTWGKLVAPWAEFVARTLWQATNAKRPKPPATPLTQQRRRHAQGGQPFPTIRAQKVDRLCRGCGEELPDTNEKFCSRCAKKERRLSFARGRKLAHSAESRFKRSVTQQERWAAIHAWKRSDLPSWLTRESFMSRVQPALARISQKQIRDATGLSEPYTLHIQRGERVPHARHWQALAKLVNVIADN